MKSSAFEIEQDLESQGLFRDEKSCESESEMVFDQAPY